MDKLQAESSWNNDIYFCTFLFGFIVSQLDYIKDNLFHYKKGYI